MLPVSKEDRATIASQPLSMLEQHHPHERVATLLVQAVEETRVVLRREGGCRSEQSLPGGASYPVRLRRLQVQFRRLPHEDMKAMFLVGEMSLNQAILPAESRISIAIRDPAK